MSGASAGHGAPATVVAVEDITPRARRITLERADLPRARAGEHVDLRVPSAHDPSRTLTRSYSVVDSEEGRLSITVLRVRDSRGGSAYLHGVEVGATVPCSRPLQNFPLRLGAARYLVVAGGIGVTALVETARVLAATGQDHEVRLLARTRSDLAYADLLAERHGDRLVTHVEDEGTGLDVEALVAEVAGSPLATSTEAYVCGPIRLMDAVRRAWERHDLPEAHLRVETFGNSGWFDPEPFEVRVPELGLEVEVPPDQSMLEALAGAGADLMYDCLKGECGLCRLRVVGSEGRLDHRDVFLSRAQQEAGASVCACVSRVVAGEGGGRGSVTLALG